MYRKVGTWVLFFLVGLVLLACASKFKSERTREQSERPLTTPVETVLNLDSTRVGVSTITTGLDVPWEIIWGPDNWIWLTEQGGTVSKINPATGEKKILLRLPDVYRKRSMGLLGMAIHPKFKQFPYVFLDYTYLKGNAVLSRLVRFTYTQDTLTSPHILLDDIPGNNGHNGARIIITPDGKLLLTTGDATASKNAQDITSLNGKVLRLNLDGSIPKDNPIPGSPVWSWGHRNQQGLTFSPGGVLFSSEHGDATDDELNIITKGQNYGWPQVQGYPDLAEERQFALAKKTMEPLKSWTPTIAPAGIVYYNSNAIPEWKDAILLTTLKDCDLRVLKLSKDGKSVASEKIYFDRQFGRLRDICVSPAGDIYMATSNRDWNPAEGFPIKPDDRIIRLFKVKPTDTFVKVTRQEEVPKSVVTIKTNEVVDTRGSVIYNQYCASCHKTNGEGVAETFPPLKEAEQVLGKKEDLIRIVLNGLSEPIKVKNKDYNGQMPAFSFLSDKDLAEVLSYVRNNFNNKASAISADDIKKVRAVTN